MKPNKKTSEELNSGLLYYGVKKTVRDEKKAVVGNRFVCTDPQKLDLKI